MLCMLAEMSVIINNPISFSHAAKLHVIHVINLIALAFLRVYITSSFDERECDELRRAFAMKFH